MKALARMTALALFAALAAPVFAEDEPKAPDAGNDEAKTAIVEAMKKAEEKSHTFTAKLDLEMGGSPMLNTEMKGEHKKPWTKIMMEMMGQEMEIYTDGKVAIQKNPQTGEWQKNEGGQFSGTMSADQVAKIVKSATWEKEEKKVGSKVCRVATAKVDKDEVKKVIAQGGMGGQAKISKSSLKYYIDKEDGRVRRMKLSMTMSVDMGGGGEGAGMDMDVTMDWRFSYSSKVKVELPEEVKQLLEEKTESGKDEKKNEKKDEDKDEEGSDK